MFLYNFINFFIYKGSNIYILIYYIMDTEITYKLIDESIGLLLKDIIGKHYDSFEKINSTETRIIIDLNIIYIEVKNSLNLMIDRLVAKFKITEKDIMFKLLVNHIYDTDTRNKIMSVNKIILNSKMIQTKDSHVKYLYEEILPILFNGEIIDFVKYYSDPILIYVYYLKTFFRNWKLILLFIFLFGIIYFTGKKLKNCTGTK